MHQTLACIRASEIVRFCLPDECPPAYAFVSIRPLCLDSHVFFKSSSSSSITCRRKRSTRCGKCFDWQCPRPSCAHWLRPHEYSCPSTLTATACPSPAATSWNSDCTGESVTASLTTTGQSTSLLVHRPVPSCPHSPAPHEYTSPI